MIFFYKIRSKGSLIDLSQSEKRTFVRFFGLYLGGSFILMVLITILYYQNQEKIYFDLIETKMQKEVSEISSQITYAHMKKKSLDLSTFLNSKNYKIAFYDENKQKLFGDLDDYINLDKDIMFHKEHFVLINSSTYGHLGIYYIAIEENLFSKTKQELKKDIFILFIIVYLVISLIGFYLAKLFLKPIKEENERLNNFIKDTTHELNTPISAIIMSIQDNELSKKQAQRIKLSVTKISEIYKDLTYIFLEDNIDVSHSKVHDLKSLILDEMKYFEVLAEKKYLEVTIDLEETKYKIDKNDFVRLFNNILSNAIKYNRPRGKINIKLKDNTLSIEDTGIGIDEKYIKDIFNRFSRATTLYGGFGIGLNIVKNVCQKYNIKFDVKSKLKEGTTFKFEF